MFVLSLLLVIAFLSGQVFAVPLCCGIRVAPLDLVVGLIALVGVMRFRPQTARQWLTIFGPFLLVGVVSLVLRFSELRPIDMLVSFLYWLRFSVYLGLIAAVISIKKAQDTLVRWLWGAGVGMGILGLLQYILYPNLRNLSYLGWDPHQYRVFGTLFDPNFMGIILVLTLVLSWYLWQQKKERLILFGTLVSVVALFLTYSRGSFAALVATACVWGVMTKKIKLLLIACVGFVSVLVLLPRPDGEGVDLLRTITVASRIENNQEALKLFWSRPVLGWGFDSLRYIRDETHIVPGTDTFSHSGAGFHNSWLFILATTGFIGLVAYIWMWKAVFTDFDKQKPWDQMLLLSVIAVFVHSQFDNSLFYPQVMAWLWVLVGSTLIKKKMLR